MSSGLLGVEGGLIRDGDGMPVSLVVLRSSRSLKLRRSEFCLKKPGLEENWWRWNKSGSLNIGMVSLNLLCCYSDILAMGYLGWRVRDRR